LLRHWRPIPSPEPDVKYRVERAKDDRLESLRFRTIKEMRNIPCK